jgi:cytochrome bd-type quinol oxidase subunit 2
MAKEKKTLSTSAAPMLFQGWLSLAIWMTVGLFLEGLLGYKIPAYLGDPQRRELFRLAHAHGTLLSLVLLMAALCINHFEIDLSKPARRALQSGAVLMPLGFLLAGIWHTESDPGLAIWLVPIAALMLLFGIIALALASRK